MRILFLVGAYPPKICGIGDYTYQLKNKLDQNHFETEVIFGLNWKTNPFKILKKINKYNPDIIHIQYPLTGLFAHILIFFCFFKYKIVITAHEFAETHWSRKISMFIFPLAKSIIWTSKLELDRFKSYFPFLVPCIYNIIPIASNIPFLDSKPYQDRDRIIGFFGSIRPGKGLDPFFELVESLNMDSSQEKFRYLIIGTVLDIYKDYYKKLKLRYSNINIEWKLNLDSNSVANELVKVKYIYLPFEDGASERRGSLLAAIGNGSFVISTQGKYVTPLLESSIEFASTSLQAKKLILKAEADLISKKLGYYDVKKYYNWDKILSLNINLYHKILKNKE
jgi:glycosyltransferase involved in cell wall biosynthesis